ncbi:hypothetical protein HN51_045024 [Arachis hypogaea]|uniref:Photosystem II 5 kDa protein n=1 Tax=Arachis hypogaea TaxID=3818 RepID=A0A444Y1D1_ARAHY|nr:photosystem II 5 kDa protein, chloroplastic [Arachis ipaensis]XP_025673323.1 photosystem II 5 kDa protein, chloroplastic [Arachis hypogaea]QHN97329.1 Photosystem II 5 kDa protein [Arachis hypogaea]RYQ95748.1 hypothetical protein Ahy_B08g091095 [Arachis hypogaea]
MASITMTTSIGGGMVLRNRSPAAVQSRLVVANAGRAVEGEKMIVSYESDKEGSNRRRDVMFGVAAAAVCSVAGIAVAEEEPKNGTPEAKKKYAPICVTMPTARVCHK